MGFIWKYRFGCSMQPIISLFQPLTLLTATFFVTAMISELSNSRFA